MSVAKRLQVELDHWRAAWQQLEAFLDRVDGAVEQDAPHAKAVCALLPVFSVVERARQRATGVSLKPALACKPSGEQLPSIGAGALGDSGGRVPGTEELEFAVGMIAITDGDLTDNAALASTVTLFSFRDEKHGGEVQFRVPTYDFGPLQSDAAIPAVIDGGLFPKAERENATNTRPYDLKKWSTLRGARLAKLPQDPLSPDQKPLSVVLDSLDLTSQSLPAFPGLDLGTLSAPGALVLAKDFPKLLELGPRAASRGQECQADAAIIEGARQVLDEEGIILDEETGNAFTHAAGVLETQAQDYGYVATQLGLPVATTLTLAQLDDVKARLRKADGRDGSAMLSKELQDLDTWASSVLDAEVAERIAYPDGSLRILRTMEWTLRFHWSFRATWFKTRNLTTLAPLLQRFTQTFCVSLKALLSGAATGFPSSGLSLLKEATTQATELAITPKTDLKRVLPGQVAVVGGDRPTLALVLGQGTQGLVQKLKISPLNVSIATGSKLPGLPGLVTSGTPLTDKTGPFTDEELLLGRAARGPQADGQVQEVIALDSRLALLLGRDKVSAQTQPRPLPRPYPGTTEFAVTPPVEPTATRLFLESLPPASGSGASGRLPIARPGELLLIRGADEEDTWWQTVATVESVDIRTGQAAKADDEVTGTPVPPCCADEDPVMIITLRDMQLPQTLTRNVTVRRDFQGFGGPSLATGVVLPAELDSGTQTITVQDAKDQQTRTVLRDPELRAATAILKSWLGGIL